MLPFTQYKTMTTTVTSRASSKICGHVTVTQQRPTVEQFAPGFRNLPLQANKRMQWIASSSLHHIRTVSLSLVQCECHIGKQVVITWINPTNQNWTADFTFSRNLCFLVPISRGANVRFAPPANAHGGLLEYVYADLWEYVFKILFWLLSEHYVQSYICWGEFS